ncbi:phage baseplate assembly protein V [Jeotgalibacillus terrae]|uniref:Phage baseplate assembly protein V n=1 Tax=Jeotgalibacillus terrae TaxID=587735 RepID=A0ABW5ZGH8_9BACL|nr:phage baseplate assembly protein V [Jeotgalibacillus terrae]MBM7580002.1 phage baseplate assembly protein gpV [Jeotgalibacillus terrae]
MNAFQVGRVSSVFPERGTAKVYFKDKDVVSRELPIVNRGSRNTKDFWMPSVDENVLCGFLDNTSRAGFILGSYFNELNESVSSTVNKRRIEFPDESVIEYDFTSNTFLLDIKGNVQIKATGNVTVQGDVISDGISLKNHTHNFSGSSGTTTGPT